MQLDSGWQGRMVAEDRSESFDKGPKQYRRYIWKRIQRHDASGSKLDSRPYRHGVQQSAVNIPAAIDAPRESRQGDGAGRKKVYGTDFRTDDRPRFHAEHVHNGHGVLDFQGTGVHESLNDLG